MKCLAIISIILSYIILQTNNKSIRIKSKSGVDIIYSQHIKLLSANILLSSHKYFFIIKVNGKSVIRTYENSSNNLHDQFLKLIYPDLSAQSFAIDWINNNLYWVDSTNRFIEIVKLNRQFNASIGRNSRRIIINQNTLAIDSIVIDPINGYLFVLRQIVGTILERYNLDGGGGKFQIYRNERRDCHNLTIDRYQKILYWFEGKGNIRRVDYQGQTGCLIELKKKWIDWEPSHLTSVNSNLLFINENKLWLIKNVHCQSNDMVHIRDIMDASWKPVGIVNRVAQLMTDGAQSNNKVAHKCQGIRVSGSCLCPTPFYQKQRYQCSLLTKSLLIYSNQGIQQINLLNASPHTKIDYTLAPKPYLILEPLLQHKFIPVYITPDPLTNAIFFIDVVQSSETIKYFSFLNVSYPSPVRIVEFPSHIILKPTLISFDSYSRNLYWLNVSEFNFDLCVGYVDLTDANKIKVKYSGVLRRMNKFRKISRCFHLIVDPVNQYIFITCVIDVEVVIKRFNLDATDEYTVIQTKDRKSGLAIDPTNQRLYYEDVVNNKIISIDYWGRKKRVEFNKSVSDISGLTYLDGHIYWINTVEMNVKSVPITNGVNDNTNSRATIITSIYNLQSVMLLMTGITIAPNSNKFGDNGTPCGRNSSVSKAKCTELCFPARKWSNKLTGYRCGCSLVNRVHLNNKENENSCDMTNKSSLTDSESLVKFNKETRNPSQVTKSMILILYNSTAAFVYSLNTHVHRLSNGSLLMKSKSIYNLLLDMMRSVIYWIDKDTNCLFTSQLYQKKSSDHYKQSRNAQNGHVFTKNSDSLYCTSVYSNSDTLTQISLDHVHNNMYLLITNQIWSRIEVMRLPFHIGGSKDKFDQSKQLPRNLVAHKMKDTDGSIMAVHVVPRLKTLLIFSQTLTSSKFVMNQCDLDGSSCLETFSKSPAIIKSVKVDQEANYLYWMNRDCSTLYQYKINNSFWLSYQIINQKSHNFKKKKNKKIDLSRHIRVFILPSKLSMMLIDQCQPHMGPLVYANDNFLHFWMDDGQIYQLSMHKYTQSTTIYFSELTQIYQPHNLDMPNYSPVSIDTRLSKNLLVIMPSYLDESVSRTKYDIAVNSKQPSYQNYIMCPPFNVGRVSKLCEHLCLPTSDRQCSCASTALDYSSIVSDDDGYDKLERCVDNSTQLLAVTHDGELLSMKIEDKPGTDATTQPWYTRQLFPRQSGTSRVLPVTLTDSLYWSKYGLVISIDIEGNIWCYNTKLDTKSFIKHAKVSSNTNKASKDEYDGYDGIYRHLIQHHTSSQLVQIDPRYRIALDTITNTFYWLDWVFGVIVSESISYNTKTGDVSLVNIGLVVDLRKSSRRPLELTLCSFSSKLIYLTGVLSVKVKRTKSGDNKDRMSPEFWRQYRIEMMEFDGSRHRILVENYRERPRSLTMESEKGKLFWSTVIKEKSGRQTMNIYSLLISWNDYTLRDGYYKGENLNLTLTRYISLSNNDPKIPVVPITVLNNRVFFPYQSMRDDNPTDTCSIVTVDAKKFIQMYRWSYLSYKRKSIIKLMIKMPTVKRKLSLLGLAEHLHPCSSKPCSHYCMSTFPIDTGSFIRSSLLLSPSLFNNTSLGPRYRCGCPLPLILVTDAFGKQICTMKGGMLNERICPHGHMICRAGRIYKKSRFVKGHCLPASLKCDKKEDCLDGSDESGCKDSQPVIQSVVQYTGPCNKTHQYSCATDTSISKGTDAKTGKCIQLSKVCDGFEDCLGGDDESCCKDKTKKFQCLTGVSSQKRCIALNFRCDNAIDCIDGSDELNCPVKSLKRQLEIFSFDKSKLSNSDNLSKDSDSLKSLHSDSSLGDNDKSALSGNTIALISGPIAGFICLITLLYFIISTIYRRYKQNHRDYTNVKKKYINKPASLLSGSSSSNQNQQYQIATLPRSYIAPVTKTNSHSDYSSNSNYQHHHYHHHHHHHHHNPEQEKNHHHHYHYQQNNSKIFQTNNVNMIMVVSSPNHSSNHSNTFFGNQQQYYHSNGYGTNKPNQYFNHSEHNDNLSGKYYQSDLSLSSLSECYRRIRDPLPLMSTIPNNPNSIIPQQHNKTTAPPLFTSRDYQELFMYNNCNSSHNPTSALLSLQRDHATPNPPAPSSIDEEEDHMSVLLQQNPPRHLTESLSGSTNPPPPPSLISTTNSSKLRRGNSRKRRERQSEEYEDNDHLPVAPRNSRVTSTAATSTDDDIPIVDKLHDNTTATENDKYKTNNYPNCVIQDLLTAISDDNSTSNNVAATTTSKNNHRALHSIRHQRIRKKTKYRLHRHHNRHHSNHSSNVLPPPPSPNSISNSSYKMTPL